MGSDAKGEWDNRHRVCNSSPPFSLGLDDMLVRASALHAYHRLPHPVGQARRGHQGQHQEPREGKGTGMKMTPKRLETLADVRAATDAGTGYHWAPATMAQFEAAGLVYYHGPWKAGGPQGWRITDAGRALLEEPA